MEFFPIQRQSTRFQRAAFTNFVFEDGVDFAHGQKAGIGS